jgi:hypothetical protein
LRCWIDPAASYLVAAMRRALRCRCDDQNASQATSAAVCAPALATFAPPHIPASAAGICGASGLTRSTRSCARGYSTPPISDRNAKREIAQLEREIAHLQDERDRLKFLSDHLVVPSLEQIEIMNLRGMLATTS